MYPDKAHNRGAVQLGVDHGHFADDPALKVDREPLLVAVKEELECELAPLAGVELLLGYVFPLRGLGLPLHGLFDAQLLGIELHHPGQAALRDQHGFYKHYSSPQRS